MTATIQKWGNSLALRLPPAVAEKIHVTEGDSVTLNVGRDGIIVAPVPKRPSLDDLLARVTPENTHDETGWGRDAGREVLPP